MEDIRQVEPGHISDIHISPLKNCARCGEDHTKLEFKKFKNPVRFDPVCTHWAICPTSHEPILMAFIIRS